VQQATEGVAPEQMTGVEIISRRELQQCPQWQRAFASQHKDSRYYEVVEDTIHPEFHYLYFPSAIAAGRSAPFSPSSFSTRTSWPVSTRPLSCLTCSSDDVV
jgi:hypothetical protein